jgi:hypothetical protein
MKRSILLKSLLIGFALLLIPAIGVMQWVTHTHPVYEKSLRWLKQSPIAARHLGTTMEAGWWVTLKSSRHTLTANVEYKIKGSRSEGEILVSAKKLGDNWQLNYIWYRPEGQRIIALLDRRERN